MKGTVAVASTTKPATRSGIVWQHLGLTLLQAEYRTERACQLPEYLGSTFRGVFGQELHAVSCMETTSPCELCRRPDRCAGVSRCPLPARQTYLRVVQHASRPAPAERAVRPAPAVHSRASSRTRHIRARRVNPPWTDARRPFASLVSLGRRRLAGIGRRGLGADRRNLSLARIHAIGPAATQIVIDTETRGINDHVPELEGGQFVAEGAGTDEPGRRGFRDARRPQEQKDNASIASTDPPSRP